jgi:hypothetical protein
MRRDLQRIVFNLVLGPLVGGVLFFAAAALYERTAAAPPNGAPILHFDPRNLPWLIGFTYFVSIPPALLNGIVTSLAMHWTARRSRRWLAALVSGAVWSGLLIGWVIETGDTSIAPPEIFTPLAAILGALTSLLVFVLFEALFRPRRAAIGS